MESKWGLRKGHNSSPSPPSVFVSLSLSLSLVLTKVSTLRKNNVRRVYFYGKKSVMPLYYDPSLSFFLAMIYNNNNDEC